MRKSRRHEYRQVSTVIQNSQPAVIDNSPPLVDHNDETSAGGHCGQAVCGRVFRNLADVHAAVAEFVERYNQCWRLEKLAYRTPSEARQEYELRHAA